MLPAIQQSGFGKGLPPPAGKPLSRSASKAGLSTPTSSKRSLRAIDDDGSDKPLRRPSEPVRPWRAYLAEMLARRSQPRSMEPGSDHFAPTLLAAAAENTPRASARHDVDFTPQDGALVVANVSPAVAEGLSSPASTTARIRNDLYTRDISGIKHQVLDNLEQSLESAQAHFQHLLSVRGSVEPALSQLASICDKANSQARIDREAIDVARRERDHAEAQMYVLDTIIADLNDTVRTQSENEKALEDKCKSLEEALTSLRAGQTVLDERRTLAINQRDQYKSEKDQALRDSARWKAVANEARNAQIRAEAALQDAYDEMDSSVALCRCPLNPSTQSSGHLPAASQALVEPTPSVPPSCLHGVAPDGYYRDPGQTHSKSTST